MAAQPDQDVPPPTGFMRLKKHSDTDTTTLPDPRSQTRISKNFKIVTPTSLEKVRKPLRSLDIPVSTRTNKVLVAVVDSGVDTLNPYIKNYLHRTTGSPVLCQPPFVEGVFGLNKVIPSLSNYEPLDLDGLWLRRWCIGVYREGHGTLINGIIAGQGHYPNQAENTTPQAADLDILNVKIMEKHADGANLFDALCAIHYALDRQAKVINASWVVAPLPADNARIQAMFYSVMVRIKDSAAILVTCAGNGGIKTDPNLKVWPGSFSIIAPFQDNVLTVGSLDMTTNLPTATSNEGSFVTVFAPGSGIQMRRPLTGLGWFCFDAPQSGSSFATAYVTRDIAKLIALVKNK